VIKKELGVEKDDKDAIEEKFRERLQVNIVYIVIVPIIICSYILLNLKIAVIFILSVKL
jgi:hypothetical protein